MPTVAGFDHTRNVLPCTYAIAIPEASWREWVRGGQELEHAMETWKLQRDKFITHIVQAHNKCGASSGNGSSSMGEITPPSAKHTFGQVEEEQFSATTGGSTVSSSKAEKHPHFLNSVESDDELESVRPNSASAKRCWDDFGGALTTPKQQNGQNDLISTRDSTSAPTSAELELHDFEEVAELTTIVDESPPVPFNGKEDAGQDMFTISRRNQQSVRKLNRGATTESFVSNAGAEDDGAIDTRTKEIRNEAIAQKMEKFMEWWEQVEEPARRGRLAKFVLGANFAKMCPLVILMDTVLTAHQTNYQAENIHAPPMKTQQVIEMIFLTFYVFELCVKLIVHKQYFFINVDCKWNIFDFILVLQAVLDFVLTTFVNMEGADMTFARLLRLMKLGKIFRLFRAVRFLGDLRVMLCSIMSSFPALFWATVTLGLILYIFALMFVQALTAYQLEQEQLGKTIDPKLSDDIENYYGNVQAACLTLYKATNGGEDWKFAYDVVSHSGALYCTAFLFFIMFFNFAVLNILTGIFMEKALHNTQPDRDSQALEQRRLEEKEVQELTRVFNELSGEDGILTSDEFSYHMQDLGVRANLVNLGLEVRDADMFFHILTTISGADSIQIEDFVHYCSRMKGGATSIDLQSLAFEVRIIHQKIMALVDAIPDAEELKRKRFEGMRKSSWKTLKDS